MKFCWAASEEMGWQTVSVVYSILDKILKFKRGIISLKKNWIQISGEYANLHILFFITTKCYEI